MITETTRTQRSAQQRPWITYFLWTAALGYGVCLSCFAVNVPYLDDYLLLFSVTRLAETGPSGLLDLFTQHNEHRILLARLVAYLDFLVEGRVNFKTLSLSGSVSVLALFYLLVRLFERAKISAWALAPIALLLFQPSYHYNLLWSLAVWQHSISLAGFVLLFWLAMHPDRRPQGAGLLLGALLIFSNSNGIFAWGTVVLLQLCYQRHREALLWAVTGLMLAVLYYSVGYDYYNHQTVRISFLHPLWLFKGLVGFLGGALFLDGYPWLKGIPPAGLVWLLGLSVLGIFAFSWGEFLLRRQKDFPALYPVLLGLTAVLTLTALGASLTRSTGDLLIIERYQIYSVLCLVVAYSLLLVQLEAPQRRWLAAGAGFFMALFSVNSYLHYLPELQNREKRLLTEGAEIGRHHHSPLVGIFLSDPYWQTLLAHSLEREIYTLPTASAEANRLLPTAEQTRTTGVFVITSKRIDIGVDKTVIDLRLTGAGAPDYLILRAGQHLHLLSAEREAERGRLTILNTRSLFRPTVISSFYPQVLPPGSYDLGLYQIRHGKGRIAWTGHRVFLPPVTPRR